MMDLTELFTKDELEVMEAAIFHRMIRLEECDLKDSKCYPLLCSARKKLMENAKKAFTKSDE